MPWMQHHRSVPVVFSWAGPKRLLHTLSCAATSLRSCTCDGKLRRQRSRPVAARSGAFYIMDRGYIDFERLHLRSGQLLCDPSYSHPVDRSTGLICDQTIVLSGFYRLRHATAPHPIQRRYQQLRLVGDYHHRALSLQVELFFKWIKQHVSKLLRHRARSRPNLDRSLGLLGAIP